MPTFSFDAQVTAALFDKTGAIFALGDGSVRFEGGEFSAAHDGAILCAVVHPSGNGVITGGDDGRLLRLGPGDTTTELFNQKGRWIDHLAAHRATGAVAASVGRTAVVVTKDGVVREFGPHQSTVPARSDHRVRSASTTSRGVRREVVTSRLPAVDASSRSAARRPNAAASKR